MGRGLSTAAKSYTGPFWWAAKITARDGTAYYFAESELSFLGTSYARWLKMAGPLRLTKQNEASSGQIAILAGDAATKALIEGGKLNGAKCELKQLLLGIEEEIAFGTFRMREPQNPAGLGAYRLTSELDFSGFKIPVNSFGQDCTWLFAAGTNGGPCGYDRAGGTLTESLAERTATAVGSNYIEDSTLTMTVDEHVDRLVFVTEGTGGKGQWIRVKTNTATRLTGYTPWIVTPTGTVKFKVYAVSGGAARAVYTASAAKPQTQATGGTARYIEDTGLSLTADYYAGDYVRTVGGTGSGQLKKIGTNTTGGRFTLDDDETDFSPAPDATTVFRVLHGECPLDFGACLVRAQEHRFNGFPSLVPPVSPAGPRTSAGGYADNEDGSRFGGGAVEL